jgi:hypothetical protein
MKSRRSVPTSLLIGCITLLTASSSRAQDKDDELPPQTGVAVEKSDQMAGVVFSDILKPAPIAEKQIAKVTDDPDRRKPDRLHAAHARTTRGTLPYPTTADVPHGTDTADTVQALQDFYTPPDTNGAVGPRHLVCALNTYIIVQDRDGKNLGKAYAKDIWAAVLPKDVSPFDPRILFDHFVNKWVMTYCASGPRFGQSALLIGVSETDDPTKKWFLHRIIIDAKDQYWIDYAILGLNEENIIVQGGLGARPGQTVPPLVGYYVVNMKDLLNGNPCGHTKFWVPYKYVAMPTITFDKGQKELLLIYLRDCAKINWSI